jgi:putative addiction module component (TIGR02574 family)
LRKIIATKFVSDENVSIDPVLPLDRMTVEEKLRAMEMLWDDLCRNEQQIPVADWQKDLLDDRQRQIEAGEAKFSDWESAKKRIRDRAIGLQRS